MAKATSKMQRYQYLTVLLISYLIAFNVKFFKKEKEKNVDTSFDMYKKRVKIFFDKYVHWDFSSLN